MSERSRYLVSYDVCDDRRLRRVYRALRGFGDHAQYSVFFCDLSARERAELVATLDPLIDHVVDQVLIVDLGPPEGRAGSCVASLGRVYTYPERHAVIV
jgi:CRISPR-associated protein Cas2